MAKNKKKILTPYGDRVLIIPEDKLVKTAGGIYIPETVVQKPSTGKVFKIGEDVSKTKVGDNVMFGKEAGIAMEVDGAKYLLMREGEIFMKYEEEA
jgi:chaperonin GroES